MPSQIDPAPETGIGLLGGHKPMRDRPHSQVTSLRKVRSQEQACLCRVDHWSLPEAGVQPPAYPKDVLSPKTLPAPLGQERWRTMQLSLGAGGTMYAESVLHPTLGWVGGDVEQLVPLASLFTVYHL